MLLAHFGIRSLSLLSDKLLCDASVGLRALKRKPHGSKRPSPGRTIATLSSREVYRNHWMRVREDEILRSNGEKGIYGVVEKHDAAIILPIDDGRVWLVEQFRYTVQERALELPQGSWEMEIDSPEELARGELKEELGLDAAHMTHLGTLWIAYGFLRQKLYVFLATGISPVVAKRPTRKSTISWPAPSPSPTLSR